MRKLNKEELKSMIVRFPDEAILEIVNSPHPIYRDEVVELALDEARERNLPICGVENADLFPRNSTKD